MVIKLYLLIVCNVPNKSLGDILILSSLVSRRIRMLGVEEMSREWIEK